MDVAFPSATAGATANKNDIALTNGPLALHTQQAFRNVERFQR
jgi:hypothetical protein